jgi:hypothetical protein
MRESYPSPVACRSVIRIRRGRVLELSPRREGVIDLVVDVDGDKAPAVAYERLSGPMSVGDTVVLNTTALALGLGTGGAHFVLAVEGGPDVDPSDDGHAIKLRYTPAQVKVSTVEETYAAALDGSSGLDGMPVIATGLHSALWPAALAARVAWPECRMVYVMTEGGALPLPFSDAVAELKARGILEATISCGQAFGGDYEAVNKFSALLAAREVAKADVVLCGMGPGNLGTGSRYGFALMEVAEIVNAAAALGGTPIVVPRLHFSDQRERHLGLSHHTRTALDLAAYADAIVPLPALAPERDALVRSQLGSIARRHRIIDVDIAAAEEALSSTAGLSTMGRGFSDEPDYFRAAAAAGILAARIARGDLPR